MMDLGALSVDHPKVSCWVQQYAPRAGKTLPTSPQSHHLVNWLNVRRNRPHSSNFWLNLRSSNEPFPLDCSGSGGDEGMNGNLYCVFSGEKYPVIRKRGRHVEVVSNIELKKF